MELKFEAAQKLCRGSYPNAIHASTNEIIVFFVQDGQLYFIKASTPLGDFNDLQFTSPERIAIDTDVKYLSIQDLPGVRSWLVWHSGNEFHRMATIPDDGTTFNDESPYRLYYGVDTDKLYMNISEQWYFIASLRHGLLKELDQDHHLQYLTEERHRETEVHQLLDAFTGLFKDHSTFAASYTAATTIEEKLGIIASYLTLEE